MIEIEQKYFIMFIRKAFDAGTKTRRNQSEKLKEQAFQEFMKKYIVESKPRYTFLGILKKCLKIW